MQLQFQKFYLLILLILSFSPSIYAQTINNSNDLCYEGPISSGLMCLDMGVCSGGVGCKNTYAIKNTSNQALNDVKVYYNESGLSGTFSSNCGIDPSGNCSQENNITFGPFGFLGKATEYNFNNNISPNNSSEDIWAKNFLSGACFSGENLYTKYTKNNNNYRGKLQACPSHLTIGFKPASDGTTNYEVSEDYNLADGLSSPMPITVELSHTTFFDVSVHYHTTDETALNGQDYRGVDGTVIIKAGEKEAKFYIDIIHDAEIELDENFSITLTNPNPNNIVTLGKDSATVTILAQDAENLPICYDDDFNTALDDKWRVLRSRGGFTPHIVNDRLRLTDGEHHLATAVTKDYEFTSKHNMIVAEFTQYAYGGCGSNHDGSGIDGADGIVMVLYDSKVGPNPVPGGSGGSIGYAQYKNNTPGFEGGWLGLAIDEYGNFANCNENRIGGLPGTSCDSETKFDPQQHRNIASIRGDGSGMNGYEFLAASAELNPKVAIKNTDNALPAHKYRMTMDARDPAHLYITLERDTNDGSGYQVIINKFDAKDAKYKQTTTPDRVRFAFTSGTGGGCNNHEIDDLLVKGVCRAYNPNPTPTVVNKADIVNNFTTQTTYNGGTKYITTKVSGKTETITGVHLDSSGDATTYSPSESDLQFKIIPYLSDGNCSTREVLLDSNGHPAVISISDGEITHDINVVMPKKAVKNARFSITALDFDEVYQNSPYACLLNSSTTGNLQGIGQCVNDEDKYKNIFGPATFQRCLVDNGAPCKSNHGGAGDAPYDNSYGCLMCTLDNNSTCSSDNFAIRPNLFTISSANNDYPDLLRAGEDYNITINAYDYGLNSGTDTTDGYNIINADNNLTITQTLLLKDDTNASGNEMHGSFSWAADFNMSNGISTNGISNEVATIKFNDVGKVILRVEDQTWAKVDLDDDRSTNDPSGILYRNCNGAYTCGSTNTRFIPHHFTFVDTNITNNDGNPGNFTYISNLNPSDTNTYNMAARIRTKIEARNKNEGITSNFKTGSQYYENPVNITPVVKDSLHGDANTTKITNTIVGFGISTDTNGTKTIQWNENNNSKVLRFNFIRDVNNSINPFDINGSELNVSLSSTYTGTAPNHTAIINDDNSSQGSAGGTVTFYYGRTHAPRQTIEGPDGNVSVFIEVFCAETDIFGIDCNKSLLSNGINSNISDDPRWFINTNHTQISYGTIGTVKQKSHNPHVTNNPLNTFFLNNGTATVPLQYDGNSGYPYKATMENNASGWLIYNKYDVNAKTNEFDVEFVKPGGDWAGIHETNTTTDSNASNRTNRRIMW